VRPLLLKAQVDGNYKEIVDPTLENNYSLQEMKIMIDCAFACVRWTPQARPPMSQVCNLIVTSYGKNCATLTNLLTSFY
jgi:hypothetical protein